MRALYTTENRIFIFTRIILSSLLFFSLNYSSAQDDLFNLNLANGEDYSYTCGSVNPGHWQVRRENCTLTTREIAVTGDTSISTNVTVPLEVRVSGSALNSGDSATIRYSIDGDWMIEKIIFGKPGVFTEIHAWEINVPIGTVLQISVNFFNNIWTDKWRLYDGAIRVGSPYTGPLPVSFLGFWSVVNDNYVELRWETATELNNDRYTIEKSSDGIKYIPVVSIKGAGNSAYRQSYKYIDDDPLDGNSYYKLSQTDFDGRISYLGILMVIFVQDENEIFEVYPNPGNGRRIFINIDGFTGSDIRISVFDTSGRKIYSKKIESANSGSAKNIQLPGLVNLSPGVYIITATTENDRYTNKFVVN